MLVTLRPYAEGDYWLLKRLLGDPAMMQHLGGPESAEQLAERHQRYLQQNPASGALFTVLADGAEVGWVGYWESSWEGAAVWECGWHVLPEAQGRGVAVAATQLLLEDARARGGHRLVHAFPSVDNAASNAVCRKLGFTLLGEVEIEYPKGRLMRANNWRFDLGERLD
jgi:RimJ/RimL family protein N-acetyltransferase